MNITELFQKGLFGILFLDQATGASEGILFLRIFLCSLLPALIGYLLGSINTAVLISRHFYSDDIRTHGSGNAGATNIMRVFGKTAAAATFIGDFAKTALSVLAGYLLMGGNGAYIAGMFSVIGHVLPLFFHFKGGKGVVCVAALVFCTEPWVGVVLLCLFVGIVALSKYISLGSVMCALMYPLMLSRIYPYVRKTEGVPFIPTAVSFIVMVILVAKHKENIQRLIKGEENKFSFKKSVKSVKSVKKK